MEENVLKLHIKRNSLNISDFKKSFNAFVDLVQALSDESAPAASWMLSVERGSMILNAELVPDDPDIDVTPMFKVIEGDINALGTGENIESCPQKARDEYKKLVAVVGSGRATSPFAEILSFSESRSTVVPITVAYEATKARRSYRAVGALTGRICHLDSKRTNQLGFIEDATGSYVKGRFSDSILKEVRSSFKQRATVSGIISYRPDGSISSMDIRGIRVQQDSVPKLSELFGILEA